MPLSFETSSIAASARMNRATQVVTRLAFCFFEPLYPHGQDRHDGAPLRIAHACPAGYLRKRSTAADTKTRLAVEQADIDARRFQGGVCPAAGPGANVGIGVAPGNCRRKSRHAGSLPRRVARPGCEEIDLDPSRRAFGPPQDEGGWRAEKRKILMARALRHAGDFRRANHGVAAPGPAFVRSVAQRIAPTEPSASSWQGLLVAPEGAPMPPECLVATRPAGAAPRPASRRLMKRPLEGRGAYSLSEVRQAGIVGG